MGVAIFGQTAAASRDGGLSKDGLATLLYREGVDLEDRCSALGPNAVTRKHRAERKTVIGYITKCGAKARWVR